MITKRLKKHFADEQLVPSIQNFYPFEKVLVHATSNAQASVWRLFRRPYSKTLLVWVIKRARNYICTYASQLGFEVKYNDISKAKMVVLGCRHLSNTSNETGSCVKKIPTWTRKRENGDGIGTTQRPSLRPTNSIMDPDWGVEHALGISQNNSCKIDQPINFKNWHCGGMPGRSFKSESLKTTACDVD